MALYRDHDGTEAYTDLPFRFMPVAKVADWFDMMREYYVVTPDFNCLDHGLRAFWTDDNANYACVYVSGPLTGRVAFLDHEETGSLEPRFRSVESFLEACLSTSAESWQEIQTDTPEMRPASDPDLAEQDWKLAQSLEPAFAAASRDGDWAVRWEREYLAGCIMVLTPYDRSEMLYRFAQDEDPDIRVQAFEILGNRKWEGAVPLLAQAVEREEPADGGAAINALGKIGTPFALEHLIPLAPKIPRSLEYHFDYALHRCGVYVTRGNGRRYFRLPGSEEWVLIGPP